ncbi:MAG: helix-turn-helix domain-containing protein [Streptosporangiaceae bacterium]
MSVHPAAPPEAELIRTRREAADPGLSRRQAAARAGISPPQWSDVERGSKKAGSGVVVPVQATAGTLARMARAVGATADELAAAGREDAASQLRALDTDRDLRQRIAAIPGLGTFGSHSLPAADGRELLPLIAEGLNAIEHSGLPAAARRELTSMFTASLTHDAARRHSELLLMLRLAAAASHSG